MSKGIPGATGEKRRQGASTLPFRYDRAIPDQSLSLAISLGLNSRSM